MNEETNYEIIGEDKGYDAEGKEEPLPYCVFCLKNKDLLIKNNTQYWYCRICEPNFIRMKNERP